MLFRAIRAGSASGPGEALDPLDRAVILYVVLPLPIFLLGWLRLWVALPLVLCVLYSLRPLVAPLPSEPPDWPVSRMQWAVALLVGALWTVFGGIGHLVYANFDWHIRDAVLHDLVLAQWPVNYGLFEGSENLLRAPLGYYLPAAVTGKVLGLGLAHLAMGLWTAAGAALFLLQVFSLTPGRIGITLAVTVGIVLFSGMDVVGIFLGNPERFPITFKIGRHLEWWASRYQYSSMTTQLFWVPNHALAAWLTIGLLWRDRRRLLDGVLPMLLVAAALWSPLSAVGLIPFMLLKVFRGCSGERLMRLLHPGVWLPALLVGFVVASYLQLDSAQMPLKWSTHGEILGVALDLVDQVQFFLLEAGFIGCVVLALRWSAEVVLALVILLLLPTVSLGPANDLVMRASIPSLAVLAIGACAALARPAARVGDMPKKVLLCSLLAVGAVTPLNEFARAIMLPAFPINMQANLIGAACGAHEAHYTAHLNSPFLERLLRPPRGPAPGSEGPEACRDPAREMLWALSRE